MMDFIAIPLVVGIITFGVYKFFELIVCRRERLNIIDRLESPQLIDYLKQVPMGLRYGAPEPREASECRPRVSTGGLRVGCLLAGLGLGLVIGMLMKPSFVQDDWRLFSGLCGGLVLLCGGVGLLVSFIVEMWLARRK